MDSAALQPADGCPECGTALLRNARFCHECGWDSKNPAAGRAPTVTARTAYGRPAWKRCTMSFFVLFTLALLLVLALRPGDSSARDILPGAPAPDFTLQTLDGRTVSLADLRGRPVVVNFWASWCPPCRAEMPLLQAAYEKYQDQGIELLAVNLDESPVAIRTFTEPLGLTFPILLDQGARVTAQYKIIPLPTTFFIGRDGVVRFRQLGELKEGQVDVLFLRLLSEP